MSTVPRRGILETRAELWAFYDHLSTKPSREDGVPRRLRMDRLTPAERSIRAAVHSVECVGAHPLLTEAVVLLQQAREKVADYVDRTKEGGI